MIRRRTAVAWHVNDENVLAYAANSLAETDCWSLEKHLEACSSCARRVSAVVLAGAAAPELSRTREAVMALAGADAAAEAAADRTFTLPGRRPGHASRTGAALRGWAVRFGWAAGPGLRLPWVLALLAVAALAVAMARLGEIDEARPLLHRRLAGQRAPNRSGRRIDDDRLMRGEGDARRHGGLEREGGG